MSYQISGRKQNDITGGYRGDGRKEGPQGAWCYLTAVLVNSAETQHARPKRVIMACHSLTFCISARTKKVQLTHQMEKKSLF